MALTTQTLQRMVQSQVRAANQAWPFLAATMAEAVAAVPPPCLARTTWVVVELTVVATELADEEVPRRQVTMLHGLQTPDLQTPAVVVALVQRTGMSIPTRMDLKLTSRATASRVVPA
jgi:hypothetical protein